LQIKAIKSVFVQMGHADESQWREEKGLIMRALDSARHLLRGSNLSMDQILPVAADFDGYFDGLSLKEALAGVRASMDDSVVATRGISYLGVICINSHQDGANNKSMIGRNGGCDLVVDFMGRYAKDVSAFEEAVVFACNATSTGYRNIDLLTNIGYIELCVEHLAVHSAEGKNEICVRNACQSIYNITFTELGKQRARSVPALAPLMTTISSRYAGQEAAVKSKDVLSHLS
jgi:hypothetical protein